MRERASERLSRLYAAVHRDGQGYEDASAAWAAYREYAVSVANGLPFPFSIIQAQNPTLRASANNGLNHIVVAESTVMGKLERTAGDALCRPRWQFGGGLTAIRPTEEGATCFKCLAIAERHSIIEWQAS